MTNTADAEMDKLRFLVGTWHADDRYEITAINPAGGAGAGHYRIVLGPGDWSLIIDYSYDAPQGRSSGHQVLTWDPKRSCYVGCGVTSRGAGCLEIVGHWEQDTLTLSGQFEFDGRTITFRQAFSDITATTMTSRQFNSVDGGPSQLFGTTIFTRES